MTSQWRDQAICATVDPDLFHPNKGDHPASVRARAVCARCPVIADCLDFALTHAVTGVWGGTTDRMRRRLRQVAS